MSKRFHSTAPATRSPTHSRTTIGRKPSPIASSTVCRTQPAIVTPVTITVSTAAARRKPARYVPWKALANFFTITCSPAPGAMRSSIAAAVQLRVRREDPLEGVCDLAQGCLLQWAPPMIPEGARRGQGRGDRRRGRGLQPALPPVSARLARRRPARGRRADERLHVALG